MAGAGSDQFAKKVSGKFTCLFIDLKSVAYYLATTCFSSLGEGRRIRSKVYLEYAQTSSKSAYLVENFPQYVLITNYISLNGKECIPTEQKPRVEIRPSRSASTNPPWPIYDKQPRSTY